MKKLLVMFLICCFSLTLVGCGNDLTMNGKRYERIGLMELDQMKPWIQYDVNVINACLIVIPFVNLVSYGWYLYEPIGSNKDFENYVKSIK